MIFKKRNFFYIIIITIILISFIKIFIFECIQVRGVSMYPTLKNKDCLLINRFEYIINDPKVGDIIVFRTSSNKKMIKRIVALQGDVIEIIKGQVIINDIALKEPYILESSLENVKRKVVAHDTVFVLGDNRIKSKDSRFEEIGYIYNEDIIGKVFFRIGLQKIIK
ncbi:signal peptidase I [Lutibacter sp. B2]|nr:signal peptidase I [Lutibacter sp. B2]